MAVVGEEAVEEEVVEEEDEKAGAMADADLVFLEHSQIKTRDSPNLMMAEQPKLLEITTTATHTNGTINRIQASPLFKGTYLPQNRVH